MLEPPDGNTWLALTDAPLAVGPIADWAVRPDCGALAVFAGTARDHSEGRTGIQLLEYEAYEQEVLPRLQAVVGEARSRWPAVGAMALVHRTGTVAVGEASVVVAVSAPHRGEAFEAARWCIDTLKATVPIWKKEVWDGGESWAQDAQHVTDARQLAETTGSDDTRGSGGGRGP